MLKKEFLLLFLLFLLTGCCYTKDNKINSMTLDEKIGQMIITGFDGSEYNDDMDRLINEYKVGGVYYLLEI